MNKNSKVLEFKKPDIINSHIDDVDTSSVENDIIIDQDYLSSIIGQEDSIIFYEIENIYSNVEKKTYRNKLALKKDPPLLKIKDNYDNEATFILTENLTDQLGNTLKEVKRAYYGFSGPEKLNKPKGFKNKVIYYFKESPLKLLFPIILMGLILITIVKNKI